MLTKRQVVEPLAACRGDALVVTTMGIVRAWAEVSSSPLDFASADSAMSHAADLALGVAMAQPDRKVICMNGDGSMMMALGTLATIAATNPPNFILFVIQNGTYEITGNQLVPGADRFDWEMIARGAGIRSVYLFDDPEDYAARLHEVMAADGPVFVVARVERGEDGPLHRAPDVPEAYLRPSLAESARALRQALRAGQPRRPRNPRGRAP